MKFKTGVATTSYMGVWRPKDTYQFLEHCHSLGAAGIQAPLNGDLPRLRARAEALGMYVEGWAAMPKCGPRLSDTAAFEQALNDAKAVNAVAIRTACLDTRRYETFSTYAEWQQFVSARDQSIEAALPILDRYKIPLGIENHKDWLAGDLAALLARHSSEYLGVCLDFGNNVSLLDDPMHAIEALAPYAVSTHLKDIAVAPAANGFLLSEVILGQGRLDLPRAIALVRQSRPRTRMSLEMITRDPLLVPCFTDKYWATFPDRSGLYLARTLRFVRDHQSRLPAISQLPHEGQLQTEEQNVAACLRYASEKLML
ncbi:MAG TPA: TIM barrel protein [Bryobacteraceae bacterium]|nr:TIM barrel protein [Bryobacteraceae bacterium]